MIRKYIVSIFLFFLIFINKTYAQEFIYNPSIDVLKYDFQIEISDTTDEIKSISTNTFILIKETEFIWFDLSNIDDSGKGMTLNKILFKGIDIEYKHEDDLLKIKANDWAVNDTITLSIYYHGIPKDGLIISNNKFGERSFFCDNWPNRAHNYIPVVDHPSDKAMVTFGVIAPNHYEVVSNGILIEKSKIDSNKELSFWESKVEIPTKVMVFAAANFAMKVLGKVDCIPVSAWVFNQNKEDGFYDYQPAVDVLDYYMKHMEDYPYQKLANVQSKTRYGGMENAGCIFYYENSVTGQRNEKVVNLIAHEVAHQWFGNSVSESDWNHIWLSEGFATYLTDLYVKDRLGEELFYKKLKKEKEEALYYIKKRPMSIVQDKVTNLNSLLSPNVYQRGAWVLHMINEKIGDEQFWEVLKTFYDTYKNENASSNDFKDIVEVVTNESWDEFFDQWLKRSDFPIMEVSTSYMEGEFVVKINQIQKGKVFKFDFPVHIKSNGVESIQMIKCNQKKTVFKFITTDKKTQADFYSLDQIFGEWKMLDK